MMDYNSFDEEWNDSASVKPKKIRTIHYKENCMMDKYKLANVNEAVDGKDLSSYFTSRNLKQKYEGHYLDMANQLRINVEQYCHFIKIKDELTNEGYKVIVDHDKKKVKILKEI